MESLEGSGMIERVVLVDDEPYRLRYLTDIIRGRGIPLVEYTTTHDARREFQRIAQAAPARILAFIDIMLPLCSPADLSTDDASLGGVGVGSSMRSGLHLCRYIRHELGLGPDVVAIICISFLHDWHLMDALARDGIRYIRKDDLVPSLVRNLLEEPFAAGGSG